jgi:hypothetical protein
MRLVALGLLMAMTLPLAAQTQTALPAGMSFVAQEASGAWRLYWVDGRGSPKPITTALEPRQACVATDGSKVVYAAADGTLRTLSPASGTETALARPTPQRSYTQPCLTADGRDVVAVEMADGKSIETDILRFSAAPEPARIARQPGAQHDPFLHRGRWLVYASVGCSEGCEKLLVEIWARDLVAAEARQLTLLNALSQGPVTDGARVVFSSNATGGFQLWQVGFDGSGLRRLTDGKQQATQPAICGGEVYFVSAGPGGSGLARLGAGNSVTELPLPGLKAIRSLRCVS